METISIKTLPIEVRLVRVGNKAMTKAVFNQIPQLHIAIQSIIAEYVLDAALFLNPRLHITIYGWVNLVSIKEEDLESLIDDFQKIWEKYCQNHFNSYGKFNRGSDFSVDGYATIIYGDHSELNQLSKAIVPMVWVQSKYPQLYIAI